MACFLLDTNILLRLADPASAHHHSAKAAINFLRNSGEIPTITPQNIIEFWAVATRPVEANGFGWTVPRTDVEISQFLAHFRVLEDTPEVFSHWGELVRKHVIMGKRVHDARLVALMKAHSISSLLTFNTAHFACFTEIRLIAPDSLQTTTT